MYEVIVSNHANSRIRERIGINKKSCQRIAEKAYNEGISNIDVTGELKNYMKSIANKHHSNALIRLYGDKVFVFAKDTLLEKETTILILVTVLSLPNNLVKKTIETKRKMKKIS